MRSGSEATTRTVSAALRVEHVSKAFPSPGGASRVVLDDVSFDVKAGEFVCLVGASGCGKTTLLRMIGGLTQPTGGKIAADDPRSLSDAGFVFQSDALIPWRTVDANVGLGLELRGVSRRERDARIAEVLAMVRLAAFGRHFPRELSGGMRQRVNIARALAISPTLLLMDEPFAALDAQTREVMQGELVSLSQKIGATVVFVTHQIDEAVLLADRIVVLSSSPGRLKEIVAPPLPRPRTPDMKRTSVFHETVDYVWNLIRDEVEQGVRRELEAIA